METLEFRNKRMKPWVRIISALFLLSWFVFFVRRYKYIIMANSYTITILIVVSVMVVLTLYIRREKLSMPPYSIKDGILYIHYGGGEVDEYPLVNFGGKIEVTTSFFGTTHLIAPSYHRYQDKIPIYFVGRREQDRLVNSLKDIVEHV